MIYDDVVQKALFTNSTIIALLSNDADYPAAPALYNDLVIPESLPKESVSINFYTVTPATTEGYGEETFTLNCRAPGYVACKALANTVRDELHRSNNDLNDTLFVVEIQRTLPPLDQTDNYNTVVQVRLTTRALR